MYKINEIFYSLQGEGARSGSANIFVRFAGCNLACSYCDTEFTSFSEMNLPDLLDKIYQTSNVCFNIIFTGGEPLLQLDQNLCQSLKGSGYNIAIETSGSLPPREISPNLIDWISISPKVSEHATSKNFKGWHVNELRYVRSSDQSIPAPMIQADHYFLSPMFSGNILPKENLDHCIDLIKKNPNWKLSLQQHKFWGMR